MLARWARAQRMNFLDEFATRLFGRTRTEAHDAGECIRCGIHVEPETWPDVDQKEYHITAICPGCYAVLLPDEKDCE